MLSRNDLTKDFELIVKQEIKNHNDSILAYNQEIQNIKKSITDLSFLINGNRALIESKSEEDQRTISKNLKILSKDSNESFSKINDLKHYLLDIIKDFKLSVSNKTKDFVDSNTINAIRESFASMVSQLKYSIESLRGHIDEGIKDIEERFSNILRRQDKRIDNSNNELAQFKKDLLQRISEVSVDKDGVQRELEGVKKTLFIQKKHIEDLYTEIKKLKKVKK